MCLATGILLVLEGLFGDRETPANGSLAQGVDSVSVEVVLAELLAHDSIPESAIVPPSRSETETWSGPLGRFFQDVHRLKQAKGSVRVAYFGDSMIEGDLVTASLRNDLQELFGGVGVGFVPLTSQTYGFRKSIKHRFSDHWKDYSLLKKNPTAHGFGISGEFFLSSLNNQPQKAWVRFEATDLFPRTEKFEQVRLFYGNSSKAISENKAFVVVTTDLGTDTLHLNPAGAINELVISQEETATLELHFHVPKSLPLYGLSFDSEDGVFVDNYASRGNSGMNLIEIPGENLSGFQEKLDYDLIVLHFGLNVVSTRRKSFNSYERGMKRVIHHFQTHVPDADILLVSVSDKSTKIKGKLQTDPSVPLIVEAQRRVAEEMEVSFLDLYQGMGGHNSMIRWVESKPSLARSDYTHPNRRGAAKVGNIVKQFLLDEYDRHQTGETKGEFAAHP